ncbi:hypothetical protein PHET_12266 [Paragonimus heterotremus]|uniref:Rnh202 triple barrel domain-containing protein n=1 Tax=Paragonimus heterotremus TaxID=100268 RepID=A0A8J4SXZ1_9TREM|nr:hypothetical protein PHET_12266 [Paragonimus heterotremus]
MHNPGLIFVSEEKLVSDLGRCFLMRFAHPRSEQPTLFLWNKVTGRLYELQRVADVCRSWFISSKIKAEGGLYLCTLFDPLFLFINLLITKNQYTTLTSLLMDKANLSNLLSRQDLLEKRLDDICDTKNCS